MSLNWQLLPTDDVMGALELYRRVFAENLSRDELRQRTGGSKTHFFYVCLNGEEPAGFCIFRGRDEEVELWHMGVLPERRLKGAGGCILDQGQRAMAALGYGRLTVFTFNRWNIFLSMLFKRGFRLIDTGHSARRDDFKLHLYTELKERREMRVALTEKCNFKCLFCHNEGLGHARRTPLPEEQTLEILREAVRLGHTDVTFTGGEPLLKKERLLFFLDGLGRFTKPPDVTLVTNGSLLDRGVVDALAAYPGERKINLSLHAADAETFAAVTGTRREDLFHTVVENIRMASQSGLRVKVNHVVLRDYNHTRALEAVELARSMGACAIKFIELLVLPDNPGDYRMFYDIHAVRKQIEPVADGPEKKSVRQTLFRHRVDSRFVIELQRCTCSVGCGHCREIRDRTFSSDMSYHPCFIRDKKTYSVPAPGKLEQVLQEGDRIIDGFAAHYKDSSPTLVQKEHYVAGKTEFYFRVDSLERFREFLKLKGLTQFAAVGFHEEYFRPRGMSGPWRTFERVLKVAWDHHDREQVDLIYTDHRYTLDPAVGLQVETRFLDASGPVRFKSAEHARHFLDRMDFEKFLELEWELETWKNGRLRLNLAVAKGVVTAKVEGTAEDARNLMQMVSAYEGRVESLNRPLAAFMID
jgi:molybdenum cofactor biosynthesis enzyme MoaA